MKNITDNTLALAGIYQTSYLVDQIANQGITDSAALDASIDSILKTDAPSTEAVFGGINGVATGLSVLLKQLANDKQGANPQVTRYVVGMLHLERKVARNPHMLTRIAQSIKQAKSQAEHLPVSHEDILATLAETYKDTVSTLSPRIMVQGDQRHLANPDNSSKVRALLLAGIRAAVLWRQCGGSRWNLLFKRQLLIKEAQNILAQIRH